MIRIAWGIGGLVGGAAAALGGRGKTTGAMCAILAIASIFGGKMLGTYFALRKEIREDLTRDLYDEFMRDANDFARVPSEDAYREFMVMHGYTQAKSADRVAEAEVERFRRIDVPHLRSLHAEKTAFEAWQKEKTDGGVAAVLRKKSLPSFVADDLNAIDIVFALLGIATAYKIGGQISKRKDGEPAAACATESPGAPPPASPAPLDAPPVPPPDAPGDEAKSP